MELPALFQDPSERGKEMTTTASKHGLRAAATERRSRHAQRTPLPPKDGVEKVELPEYAEAYGKMTQPQLRKALKEKFGVQSANDCPKGKLLEAILKRERAQREETREDRIRAAMEKKRAKRAEEDAAERRNEKMDVALPGDSKSAAKAIPVREVMSQHGWSTVLVPAEDTTPEEDIWELTGRRGNEVLWISWTKGVLTTEPMPSYTIADRTIKLRNASAVRQYAERTPAQGEAELAKVASNRYFRRKPTEPKPAKLPFDPETATDREIIKALMGKAVAWHNRLREMPETGHVGTDDRKIYFTEYGGERIFNFLCPANGHRAFRMAALLNVSGRSKAKVEVRRGAEAS